MQISLLTPLFNRLDLTRACLESAGPTLAGWDYEWIFVDDGSTDGTREFLRVLEREDPRVRVVLNDAPRGFAANNNAAARLVRAPLLCLLNNDTALLPGWLEPMARLASLLPDVACVGNVQREPVSGLVDHAGIFFDRDGEARHAAKDASAPPPEDYLEWPAVTAACCVVRREVFLGLGGFDEAFRNGSEDTDFCLRAGTRGYRHYVANRSVIYHHISASPGRKQNEADNRRLFRERWGAFLQGKGRARRTLSQQREEGQRYLRKHRRAPWRFNLWRLGHALEQVWSPVPPSRQLDLLPRLWLRTQDWRTARERQSGGRRPPGAPARIFLVVSDTVQTADRTGVPTLARKLAGAFGQMRAPVRPVVWKSATRSLGPLPPEWSAGLEAEHLRTEDGGASAASVVDPAMGEPSAPLADTPSLHEVAAVPPGAWIVLPEVWDRERTAQLVDYAHQYGWRLAVVFYGAMPTNEPQFFPLGTAHQYEGYLRAISGADQLLPMSNFAAADWYHFSRSKALPSPPMTVCAPGTDTVARSWKTAQPPGASEPVRILCVSAVVPSKNHRALLAAFDLAVAARPELNLELTLVGVPRLVSEDDAPAAVRAFVERHPGRVTWIEWVEYGALGRLYEAAAFTVFPSVLEGWGLPILESLWFGRPCICASFGAMVETAAGGGCLTVDVRDPQALADAIISLAESPERREALAVEIAARPLRTWEEYAREVLAILSKEE